MSIDDPKTTSPDPLQPLFDKRAEEGRAAYLDGQPITDKPYLRGSVEWEAWRDGYDG